MTRPLIVHIGMSKAGSTSIQYMLGAMRGRLERLGVRVPRAGSGVPGDHHNLPRTTAGSWTAQPGRGSWPELLAEIQASPAERFVLSSELFTRRIGGAPCALRLRELAVAADLEVRVVAYVRPQSELMASWYGEQVNIAERMEPFDAFVAEMLSPAGGPEFDYNVVFEPWRAEFCDALEVFPLERGRPREGLLAHFLGLLGVDGGDAMRALERLRPPRANLRVGAKELEVRRLVSAAAASLPEPSRKRLQRRLGLLPALLRDDAPFAGLDRSGAASVMDSYAASNAQFALALGIDPDGVLFREPCAAAPAKPTRAAWENLDAPERRAVRAHVLARTGVDLDPSEGPPRRTDGWAARRRIASALARHALRLPGRWRQAASATSPFMLRMWLGHTLTGRWR